MPERDRPRLLDLLERALLRVCRRCDHQSAQGGQANRDEASEIAHVSCLLRYLLFGPTKLGEGPDIPGTQPASKGPNIDQVPPAAGRFAFVVRASGGGGGETRPSSCCAWVCLMGWGGVGAGVCGTGRVWCCGSVCLMAPAVRPET